jgi:hypothetical protein
LWPAFRTVTAPPETLSWPFHTWLSVAPEGAVQVTVQELIVAVLELRTVTSPWKPPCHDVVTRYVAVQAPEPPPPAVVVTVRPGDAADVLPAASRARTLNVYEVEAVSPVAW